MAIEELTVANLTTAKNDNSTVEGSGVYDVVMNSVRAHVFEEYEQGRLTGQEYAEVYLGATQSAMAMALDFLLKKDLVPLEAENLRLTGIKIEKEGELVDAQVIKLGKEGNLLDKQVLKVNEEITQLQAETLLTQRRADNELKQGEVLDQTVCKLKAEFDLLTEQRSKVSAETSLLTQKKLTEQAQISGAGVDEDSVIGRQKILYQRQAEGFLRDAEQKAARIYTDTWNVRRTTDEGTLTSTAGLDDSNIASVLERLKAGIGA